MNKNKYIESINKIKIDENLMNDTMKKIIENKKEAESMKKNSKFKIVKQLVLATAAMFILTAGSFIGYAALSGNTKILERFGIKLEGTDTSINVVQNDRSLKKDIEYTIKYPEDMIVTKEDGLDIYSKSDISEGPNENGVIIPDLNMKIYTLDEDACANMVENILQEMDENKKYKEYNFEENVQIGKNAYQAYKINITKGLEWNSEVKEVYIINVNEHDRFVIEINYFIEATEGFGSTMKQVLSTLEIK